jgi:hypothetical protein
LDKKMKKTLIKVFLAIFVASLFFPLFSSRTESANLTTLSDTMSRLKLSASSNHTIVFTTPTGVAAGQKIKVTFPSGFASGLNSVAFGDMDLLDDGADLTLAGTCATTTWGVAVATRTITFTSCTGTIAASSVITIKIGTNATGGSNQIANPGSSGSNVINLEVTTSGDVDVDTGSLAVAIMTEDQVTVTATVNPTITSALSGTGYPTCALGTLSQTAVAFCTYTNTISTNAGSGYTATIFDDGNLRDGGNDIDDAGVDNDVDMGSEEYGVGTSATGEAIVHYTTCANNNPQPASAILTSAQQYAHSTGPASDAINLCHAASIGPLTPPGSYSHLVTHITTGHF